MIEDKRLLIVSGTGRNVGKTEFTCRLIEKFSSFHEIYGLKVSTIYPDKTSFQHDNGGHDTEIDLYEETRSDTGKDTSRMLRAGARKVFYLRSDTIPVEQAFRRFRNLVPQHAAVICESNTLWRHVRPGLLILIQSPEAGWISTSNPIADRVDLIVVSDGVSGFAELSKITYCNEDKWSLNI